MKNLLHLALVLFVALAFVGCDSDDPDPGTAPTAITDAAEVAAGQAVTINVLTNDTDAEGDALALTDVEDPTDGAVTFTADGEVTITPSYGFAGTDQITYTIEDTEGNAATGTINLSVIDAAVGSWLSEGDNLGTAFAELGFTSISVVFDADGGYIVTSDFAGTPIVQSGVYTTSASSNGDIRTIRLEQSVPSALVAEGIYEVDGDGLVYEAIDVSQGTPPTAEGGFGSSIVPNDDGSDYTQTYVRVEG
jgi:hypothetical protein